MLYNKQCSWKGCCEDLDLLLEVALSLSPLRNVHPMHLTASTSASVRVRMCVVYFCLYVYLACVCTVKRDGKRPGSSSSFGTKGNMTQMDAISPNRSGPAAQKTQTHTQKKHS